MWTELRIAARQLLAAPLFTTFAVLSLAFGVAVTAVVYSTVDAIFFIESGIDDPDRVAFVATPYDQRALTGSVSAPDYRDLRSTQQSFTNLAATKALRPALVHRSGTDFVRAEAVTGEYFQALGVEPTVGRVLLPPDESGQTHVVVLSHALWRGRFGGDPAIVGQSLRLSGSTFQIVGIAPASFRGVRGGPVGTQLWIPLGTSAESDPTAATREQRDLLVFGHLRPEATTTVATAELRQLAANLDRSFPTVARGSGPAASERPWSARSLASLAAEDNILTRFGQTLMALALLVLVVACTNLSNLVLARGTTRRQTLVIKAALGAPRWRLIRGQFAESLLLGAAGAVASYVLFIALRQVMSVDFYLTLPTGEPLTLAVRPVLEAPTLVVAAGALALSLIVFGLEPAAQLTRALDLRSALAVESGAARPRVRRQNALVRWQVATSAGFFIISTMFLQHTVKEARHRSGIELEQLAVAVVDFDAQGWGEARRRATLSRIVDEGRHDPSLAAVSVSAGLPFGIPSQESTLLSLVGEQVPPAETRRVMLIPASPSLLQTLGVPILRGRAFDETDSATAPTTVILSDGAARRVFGTIDVVGRQVTMEGHRQPAPIATIVGVAGETDVQRILAEPGLVAYVPLEQQPSTVTTIAARSTRGADHAARALRDALRRADQDLAVESLGTGTDLLSGPFVVLRAAGGAAITLGLVTLLLAMVGLFGVQSQLVAWRTREIGIRMALGATPGHVRRMVLAEGYRPVFEGLGIGLVIGVVGRAIARAALEVEGSLIDPWMVFLVPVPLMLAAFCACYLPARSASAVAPNAALRQS